MVNLLAIACILSVASLPFGHTSRDIRDGQRQAPPRLSKYPFDVPTQPDFESMKPDATHPQPLIGILSQPGDGDGGHAPRVQFSGNGGAATTVMDASSLRRRHNGDDNVSYIAASYVKWVEMAGARPVPLIYDEPVEVLRKKFMAINGLIIPGGGTDLVPGRFMSTVQLLLQWAVEANDAGDYFPVHGTCMGMEALTIHFSQDWDILQLKAFSALDLPSSLTFVSNWAEHRSLFAWMTPELISKVQGMPLTMENHGDGTTVDRFLSNSNLRDFFFVLTTSLDANGTEYVTTIQAKHYPIYGTQWHPEKNAFEWGLPHIPHSAEAIAVCQAAANFFVNEARRSQHAPLSDQDLNDLLIYNIAPIFSGRNGHGFFEQSYVFRSQQMPQPSPQPTIQLPSSPHDE